MKFRFLALVFLLAFALCSGGSPAYALGGIFNVDSSGDNSAAVDDNEGTDASEKIAEAMSKFEKKIIKGLDKFEKSVNKLTQKAEAKSDSIASVLAAVSSGKDSAGSYESKKESLGNSLKNLFRSIKDLIKTVVNLVKTKFSEISQEIKNTSKNKKDGKQPKTSGSKKPTASKKPAEPTKPTKPAKPAKPAKGKNDAVAPKGSGNDDIDLAQVAWDGHDIRNWPVTSKLSAGVSGGKVSLKHDKANAWPDVGKKASDGGPVTANAWVIAKIDGQWRAATWEWIRKGQQGKAKTSVAGDHVKRGTWPKDWRPSPGETIYLGVSGLCRDKTRNVSERSQFQKVVWP